MDAGRIEGIENVFVLSDLPVAHVTTLYFCLHEIIYSRFNSFLLVSFTIPFQKSIYLIQFDCGDIPEFSAAFAALFYSQCRDLLFDLGLWTTTFLNYPV